MKIRLKILFIIVEILLFASFFLTWFGDGDMVVLRGVDFDVFMGWLIFFYIGTWFCYFKNKKRFMLHL